MCVSVRRRLGGLASTVLLSGLFLTGLGAAAAQASVPGPGACDNSPLSRPFLAWGDTNSYKLVPGGDFERPLAGWTLTGAAARVSGSEPAGATGAVGSSSLRLRPGASAQSPSTCVNAAYPSLRFFVRSDNPSSTLVVSVVYRTLFGDTALPVGYLAPGAAWTPTTAMPTLSAVAVLAGGTAPVELRFTQLTGTSQVDDVFVDPHTIH